MKHKISFTLTKIKLAIKTLIWFLSNKSYAFLAGIIAFIFFEFIYWVSNLAVFWKIFSSFNIDLSSKLQLFYEPIISIKSSVGLLSIILTIVLSIVQGLAIAMIVYSIRHRQKTDDIVIGESTFATILAVIGLGCPSCGTSLITPIVAIFVSGSSIAISERINYFAIPLALIIGLFSLYSLGLKLSTIRVSEDIIKP